MHSSEFLTDNRVCFYVSWMCVHACSYTCACTNIHAHIFVICFFMWLHFWKYIPPRARIHIVWKGDIIVRPSTDFHPLRKMFPDAKRSHENIHTCAGKCFPRRSALLGGISSHAHSSRLSTCWINCSSSTLRNGSLPKRCDLISTMKATCFWPYTRMAVWVRAFRTKSIPAHTHTHTHTHFCAHGWEKEDYATHSVDCCGLFHLRLLCI